MPAKASPNFLFSALDGTVLALSESRFDERQRRQRHHLTNSATCWDYAPLLDVVRREHGIPTHRFTGKSAAEWVADLRRRKSPELDRFSHWYESLVGHFLGELSKRARIPDKLYSIELARPPVASSLPSLIRGSGLKRASAEQWAATLRSMTCKGVKPEELDESGVLIRLETQFEGEVLSLAQIVRLIDLRHVMPKFACESRFGFITKAGWNECGKWVPAKEYKKRGLWGSKGDGSWYVIRYRHRALGWSVVRCRYSDLFTRRPDWWWVLDERGKAIAQPTEGFDSPEDAIEYAELRINQRFSSMGRDHALSKWERYSLPGSDGYREILIQLDDWPGSYGPPETLYRSALPEAARLIAKVLNLKLLQTSMQVRSNNRWVELADAGWIVRNRSGVPITKPFSNRGQAEVFADLTGSYLRVNVPVLWLGDLPPIRAIPLYGMATEEFWLQSASELHEMTGGRNETRS